MSQVLPLPHQGPAHASPLPPIPDNKILLDRIGALLESTLAGPISVSGPAGTGKTRLIAQYLEQNKGKFPSVLWITEGQLVSRYREFGHAHGIVRRGESAEDVKKEVKGWLETHGGWVIVVKKVSDFNKLVPQLPTKGGKVITISREPIGENSLVVEGNSQQESVNLLLSRAIDQIQKEMPQALDILYLMAYLDEEIPEELLFGELCTDEFHQSIEVLLKYGLITRGENRTYLVQSLVQAGLRERITGDEKRRILQAIALRINFAWFFSTNAPQTWLSSMPLAPHLASFCRHGENDLKLAPFLIENLNRLGKYTQFVEGDSHQANVYYQQALHLWRQTGGEDHNLVYPVLSNAAAICDENKEYDKAIALFYQALEMAQRLGDQTPDYARPSLLLHLSRSYAKKGDRETALRILKEAGSLCRDGSQLKNQILGDIVALRL